MSRCIRSAARNSSISCFVNCTMTCPHPQGPQSVRAFEQLMNLEMEFKQSGTIYNCPSGHHDDLAISCAMLVWAARHPHLAFWWRVLWSRGPRSQTIVGAPSAAGWT